MNDRQYILKMLGITKTFFGVKALDGVDFCVQKGSVHALIGENGAGKSTLMKILAGVHQPDSGKIIFKGEEEIFHTPSQAMDKGISMIHQELSPIMEMTIAENLFLGREPMHAKTRTVDFKAMNAKAAELLKMVGLTMPPATKMRQLSVAQIQLVEVAKAVDRDATLIIMDEPTSALSDREIQRLFDLIRKLKEQGRTIIYISHKLDEIFAITDHITVLRDGALVGSHPTAEMTKDMLITMMVARELVEVFPKRKKKPSQNVKLSLKNYTRSKEFRDISFELYEGEILGLVGLMGAGRTELVECLFGATKRESGTLEINGKPVQIKTVSGAIKNGLALVTEDRKQTGLVLGMSIRDNLTLANLPMVCTNRVFLNRKREAQQAESYISSLKIKLASQTQLVQYLSGGNQQKVVIGKWLMTKPDILILDEPTRGIDIGAKSEIYQLIADLADSGITVLMVSSEMEEILGLCDRMVVFHEGTLTGEMTRETATQEKLMKLATGMQPN